jgi:hypothetical protein
MNVETETEAAQFPGKEYINGIFLAVYRAGIFEESIGARNRGGIGLLYRPARLHRLAEFIPWN